ACSSAAMVAVAFSGRGMPGLTATGAGMSMIGSSPGRAGVSGSANANGSPSASAAAASDARSPKATSAASHSRCAARATSSGPTPAGSPGTSASRGRGISARAGRRGRGGRGSQPDVDVGFAAHLAQEPLPLFLELALADAFPHLLAAVLVRGSDLALAFALHDVPAGLGLEGCRDLAVGEGCHLLAEVHAVGVAGEPAELAALGGGGLVVGVLACQFAEVGAAGDPGTQGFQLSGGGRVVFAGDQDVARPQLCDHPRAGVGLAPVDQLQQLE